MDSEHIHRDDWDRHWDDYAEVALVNPAQRLRRRIVLGLLALDGHPRRIVDIGCGQGDLLADLRSKHPEAELCGLDVSQSGIDCARSKVSNATFVRCDLTSDDEIPRSLAGWATHAICSEVLEHVDDPRSLLEHARQLLAPGCRLVVTVPGGPMSRFDRHIGHRRHFTPETLAELLTAAGLRVEKTTGVGFPMFNLYRLVVVLRGEGLVRDVASANHGRTSVLARLAMRTFDLLLRIGAPENRLGWQVAGVARVPAG